MILILNIYINIGNGKIIPAGYDEWSDLAASHYISENAKLEKVREIRAGYYYYPILPIIEAEIISILGIHDFFSPVIVSVLLIFTINIYFSTINVKNTHDKYLILGYTIIFILTLTNPRLRYWDPVPHIVSIIYFLALFYLLEYKQLNIPIILLISIVGIILHIAFLLFIIYYIIREIITGTTRYSERKLQVLSLAFITSYVYYSSTGVISYLISEIINVSIYKRIPATLATGSVPVFSYLIPLVIFLLLPFYYSNFRRKILNFINIVLISVGILLGLSGRSNYGRHFAATGYSFLMVEDIDTRKILGTISLTFAGLLIISSLLTISFIDSGGTLDWAPHKFCNNSFSVPCVDDTLASKELIELMDDRSYFTYRIFPEPRIEPALSYFIVIKSLDYRYSIDSKLLKASKDTRTYPYNITSLDNILLFYNKNINIGVGQIDKFTQVWYAGYGRVLVYVDR